jgi:hypothetical protein
MTQAMLVHAPGLSKPLVHAPGLSKLRAFPHLCSMERASRAAYALFILSASFDSPARSPHPHLSACTSAAE